MSVLFGRTERVVEKDYKEKSYFSDRQPTSFKNKCFLTLLLTLVFLLALNIYQTMEQSSILQFLF